ncbi:RNA-metabolising metallo-beta-lactamase [Pyrolobus fumarii 1A]|uniref:RNA-metabolising metallo-beta-lactamase n=1 Tax=Pyrolobus fumarii (strain DSM 11204 / 1A) TaxID=694429 RepID=G0EH89_PYRF1|nr:RNA-metabolising metallo-beta-lactamase [Pyrolobus fumarii 1A]
MSVEVEVLGGAREVGRASIALRYKGRVLLLDAGVNFDEEDKPVFARTVPPRDVDGIVLTHAHLDHIGTAPAYYITYQPPIIATKPTFEMARLMWEDFLKLNGYYSMYEDAEVKRLMEAAVYARYYSPIRVGDEFSVTLYPAGHIPGSAMVYVEVGGRRILYTGDVNTIYTKLMEPARVDGMPPVDLMIMEATYGASTHPPRKIVEERLVAIVEEVVDRGGTVLIPAFSISRGQEVMMILAERDLGIDVAVDGMVRQVTDIFLENPSYIRNVELLAKAREEFLFVQGWQDRRKVWKRPGVIIASAGMLKGGPSLYYLKKIMGNPKNAVVMVSFQAPGTPGRKILEEGLFHETGEPIRARVEWLDLSSHADRRGLLELVARIKPAKVLIVHSDGTVADSFAQLVRDKLGVDVEVAEEGRKYTL